eukprot:5378645-Heterocapsa_arctica.AAC.1
METVANDFVQETRNVLHLLHNDLNVQNGNLIDTNDAIAQLAANGNGCHARLLAIDQALLDQ